MNALDAALVYLNQSAGYLDKPKPSRDDVKEALDRAQEATRALKHAHGLLEMGTYTVAAEPPAGTALPFGEE